MSYPIELAIFFPGTYYAVIHHPNGTVWNNVTLVFEAFNAAHWTQYAIVLSPQGASGYYSVAYPSQITGVLTTELFYQQAGGGPLITDQPPLGQIRTQGQLVGVNLDKTAYFLDPASAGGVWTVPVRTLTQSAPQVVATVQGTDISVLRGDEWVIALTGLGVLTGRTKLWFTVKATPDLLDSAAAVEIIEGSGNGQGLVVLNGAPPVNPVVAADGSVVVTDATAGNLTITLKGRASAILADQDLNYDIQILDASGNPLTKTAGALHVVADVTRATS